MIVFQNQKLIDEIYKYHLKNFQFQEIQEYFCYVVLTENLEIRPLNIFTFNYATLKRVIYMSFKSFQSFFINFFPGSYRSY